MDKMMKRMLLLAVCVGMANAPLLGREEGFWESFFSEEETVREEVEVPREVVEEGRREQPGFAYGEPAEERGPTAEPAAAEYADPEQEYADVRPDAPRQCRGPGR